MNILITGATGFVGKWLTKDLIKEGHTVRIIHRKSSDLSFFKNLNVETILGDVTDKESLVNALKGIDVVFHLAGVIGYSKAMRKQMDKVNVQGTRNIVDACIENGNIQRLIHMSSVVAVGASTTPTALNEESSFNISHLNLGYFETKRMAEDIIREAVHHKKLSAVMVNPSTIYGPGDSEKSSRKVQLKVLQGKFPFYTPGGVSIVHIEDVIYCLKQAWKIGEDGERYIVSGENITIKNLFEIIAEIGKVEPPKIALPKLAIRIIGLVGDFKETIGQDGGLNSENYWTSTMYHWFDSSKAQKKFNFKPKSAREAIGASVNWTIKNKL